MTEPAIPIVLKNKCSVCGKLGCRADRCPDRPPSTAPAIVLEPLSDPDIEPDKIGVIAQLRETFDALAVEIGEYERVRTRVDLRIAENHRLRAELAVQIKRLRGGR